MVGDVCKGCGNFQPCQCEEVADQKTACKVCGMPLYVPAWALEGQSVTCYEHKELGTVVGVHAPMEEYRPPTPDDVAWVNRPETNWGMY